MPLLVPAEAADGLSHEVNKGLIHVLLMRGHPLLPASDWQMIIQTCLHVKGLIGLVLMVQ